MVAPGNARVISNPHKAISAEDYPSYVERSKVLLERLAALAETASTDQGTVLSHHTHRAIAELAQVPTASAPVRRRVPRLVVEDSPGSDLRPDPQHVQNAAELVEALQEFRAWAGDVPYRVMAERSGQLASASALHRALTRNARPPLNVVLAVITGCGGSEDDKRRFASAWRRIRLPQRAASHHPAGSFLRAVPTPARASSRG
jgi:hypothetical protein